MEPQDDLDYKETTEIDPTILRVNQEYVGLYRSHVTQGAVVDILLDDDTTTLLRLDDPESYLVSFFKGLELGQKIAILRLDESKYFVRRIIKNINPSIPSK